MPQTITPGKVYGLDGLIPPGMERLSERPDAILVIPNPGVATFAMHQAWCADPRLRLADLGFLARLAEALDSSPPDKPVPLRSLVSELVPIDELVAAAGRVAALGYISAAGGLVNPFESAMMPRTVSAPAPKAAGAGSSVYYVLRLSDGAVKIGWTGNPIEVRLDGLSRSFGPVEVLALEADQGSTETIRHCQFAGLRMPDQGPGGGTEWFYAGVDLVEHVDAVRAAVANA